jgi:aromatic-amino-acid transaminase
MFETLTAAPPDGILAIMAAYRADPRKDKLDLSVGVYKDAAGGTPIMQAVRLAEPRLHAAQITKTYLGTLGDLSFVESIRDLVFGPAAPKDRLAGAQTAGGSGALRLLADIAQSARPGARVFAPSPTWANHIPLLGSAGLKLTNYRYVDPASGALDVEGMLADLAAAGPGDFVLLHGCCHNPTGVDLAPADWDRVAALILSRGATPFVDLAYMGLGDGLDEDAYGVRLFAKSAPEMLVAVSCSKNFSVYRDRVGAAFVLTKDADAAKIVTGRLGAGARVLWSMPPDHGAATCDLILRDAGLRANWDAELSSMRQTILTLRDALASALAREVKSDAFAAIRGQKGMFSRLSLSPGQAERLKTEHGIYLVPDGRINIAGLNLETVERFAKAFAATR